MAPKVTSIVVAGIGGQGVVKASDILAEVLFRSGYDVKKSELHGMSQRGGSVSSEVRFGAEVFSPMVPTGEADFLVVLEPTQVETNRGVLAPHGVLITPEAVDAAKLPTRRSLNMALLGVLSRHLSVPEERWLETMAALLPPAHVEANRQAFRLGRDAAPALSSNPAVKS